MATGPAPKDERCGMPWAMTWLGTVVIAAGVGAAVFVKLVT